MEAATRELLDVRYSPIEEEGSVGWSERELEEIVGERLRARPDGLYTARGRRIARTLDPHPLAGADRESLPL